MTPAQFADLTMPQLLSMLGQQASKSRPITPVELEMIRRNKQDALFDRVCTARRWSPARMAAMPPAVLAAIVQPEVKGSIGDPAKLAELAADYARRRKEPDRSAA